MGAKGIEPGLAFKKNHARKFSQSLRSKHHTIMLEDGVSWVNKGSIIEQNDVENLVELAHLAKRASPIFANQPGLPFPTSPHRVDDLSSYSWLRIPRRPNWSRNIDAGELHNSEKESFLIWRQELAKAEESEHFIITPFERNLEVWRQLWRVLESCDTIVQIVDARNPLLFFCDDICQYTKELNAEKKTLLLINKADFLTPSQRREWAKYLSSIGLQYVFYSAKQAEEENSEYKDGIVILDEIRSENDNSDYVVINRVELLNLLKSIGTTSRVGMVGYPNVGKSSTINSLVGAKRVAVASIPGKTKHIQTILLENGITLYDCPGLVFPNLSSSKAELVLNGILPIDQLREWIQPVTLLLKKIPLDILQRIYGISMSSSFVEENSTDHSVSASEFLSAFAAARGFMTSFHGNPDESRAARIVLKDFVNGKLLYCYPPPSFPDSAEFNLDNCERLRRELGQKKLPETKVINYLPQLDENLKADSKLSYTIRTMNTRSNIRQDLKDTGKKHYNSSRRKH